jgi:hypothetical protein
MASAPRTRAPRSPLSFLLSDAGLARGRSVRARRSRWSFSFLFYDARLTPYPKRPPVPFAFEKLLVYQKSINFADAVCAATRRFPRGYFFLADQLNRAALSIAANLAEGNGRFTVAIGAISLGVRAAVSGSACPSSRSRTVARCSPPTRTSGCEGNSKRSRAWYRGSFGEWIVGRVNSDVPRCPISCPDEISRLTVQSHLESPLQEYRC